MAKVSLLTILANVILEVTLQETSVHMPMIEESQVLFWFVHARL